MFIEKTILPGTVLSSWDTSTDKISNISDFMTSLKTNEETKAQSK